MATRAITFPNAGGGVRRNAETGIEIRNDGPDGWAVRTFHGDKGDMFESFSTLAEARKEAAEQVQLFREEIAAAYDEAHAENTERSTATAEGATPTIEWRTSAGTPIGVDTAYIGTAEHASYLVESRGHYNPYTGRTRKEFRAFRMVGGKRVPAKDGGPLETRKAAYEQAEADYADVMADYGKGKGKTAGVIAARMARGEVLTVVDAKAQCLRVDAPHFAHMAAVDETCRLIDPEDDPTPSTYGGERPTKVFQGEPDAAADSEVVHFWPNCGAGDEWSVCGVDINRTPYTYGSPVWAEVDCPACLAKGDWSQVTRTELPSAEQSMTFTAAEMRIIRAVFAAAADIRLSVPEVESEEAYALWKRMTLAERPDTSPQRSAPGPY